MLETSLRQATIWPSAVASLVCTHVIQDWFTPSKNVRHGRSLLKKTCMSGFNMTVKRAIKNGVVFIFNML